MRGSKKKKQKGNNVSGTGSNNATSGAKVAAGEGSYHSFHFIANYSYNTLKSGCYINCFLI